MLARNPRGRLRVVRAQPMTETTPPAAWQALIDHRRALAGSSLAALFAGDTQRFTRLSLTWDDWLADWSKQRLTAETMTLLVAYARARNLPAWLGALFAGEKINLSEQRAVLHTALRQAGRHAAIASTVPTSFPPSAPPRRACARSRYNCAAACAWARPGGRSATSIHIGIGGSDLGARLVCSALTGPRASRREGIDVTFVSNVDPEHLTRALGGLDPATTLFIVTSKILHHDRDAAQRNLGAGVVGGATWRRRRAGRAFHRGHRQCRGGARLRRGRQ